MSLTHIVETFFDIDRPAYRTTEEWVRFRHKFLHEYTLEALMAQTFGDFRILIHCGTRNEALTRSLEWHGAVRTCYDYGRMFYGAIASDVAITRIDSDDLLREDAMAAVRAAVRANPRAKAFAFKQNLCWDMINGIIFDHIRGSTPFVTRVWPAAVVRDWNRFRGLHFRAHGGDGLGDRGALELPRRMVLVTKHGQNTNLLKRRKAHPVLTAQEKAGLKAYHDDGKVWKVGWRTIDPVEIAAIVRRFAVDDRRIP